jgi:hypothetical protein
LRQELQQILADAVNAGAGFDAEWKQKYGEEALLRAMPGACSRRPSASLGKILGDVLGDGGRCSDARRRRWKAV